MAHQKEKVVKDNAERWLLTYADLMNLLLIFFIILYSISQTDKAKFDQLSNSIRVSLGLSVLTDSLRPSSGSSGAAIIPSDKAPSPVITSGMEQQQMEAVKKKVEELVKKNSLTGKIDVSMEERGVDISITAQLLFKPGSDSVEPNSKPTIKDIGTILSEIPGKQIRVEGHTDSDPIHNSKFDSNWELSVARATKVVRLLIDKSNISPKLIAPTGYGEEWPVAPNSSVENKAMNRRVNIVILKDVYSQTGPQTEN